MKNQPKSSNSFHIVLWVAQLFLAASLIWAASQKWLQPLGKLSGMWPWTGQVPFVVVKFTRLIDFAGAVGLILPSLFRIQPKLTPIAAISIVGLMLCAVIFHIIRGEASVIGVNIIFAGISAFVAWGRLKKVPISSK